MFGMTLKAGHEQRGFVPGPAGPGLHPAQTLSEVRRSNRQARRIGRATWAGQPSRGVPSSINRMILKRTVVLFTDSERSAYKCGMPKRSQQATRDTRTDILKRALDLASIDGLSGVTIGRLSDSISMSKSGLFAHFGSKEDLQMAIVDAAAEAFEKAVVGEERAHAGGLPRLVEVAEAWIRYLEKGPFRGGCFFAAVSPEIDDRPGRVRDRVVELTRGWLAILEAEAEAAREAGDLGPDADPSQLAFEIHAFVQEANWAFQLHGDAEAFRRARRAVRRTLHSAGATTD